VAARRLLIFVHGFAKGGSERQAVELARCIDRSEYCPILGCFHPEGPLLSEVPKDVEVVPFPLHGFVTSSGLRAAKEAVHFMRRARIDILQTFDFYSNVFALPLAAIARVPIRIGARRDEASMRSFVQHRSELLAYRLATAIVANSKRIGEQLIHRDRVRREKVIVIPNGIDVGRFFSCPNTQAIGAPNTNLLKLAVIANLRPEKGHLVLLNALQNIKQIPCEARLAVAGQGPMRAQILDKVAELGLQHEVELLGEVQDIGKLLSQIDIVVLPSLKNEGLPNSVMEAMAAAKPVVATDCGGTSELVVNGHTGYLVEPGNVAQLADALKRLAFDPELRKKMGEAGRARVAQCFTNHRMAESFVATYRKLSASKRRKL